MSKIVIDRPRDPLAGMIASYRGAYARKWRVQVEDASQTGEARPAVSVGETNWFDAAIRNLLGVTQ